MTIAFNPQVMTMADFLAASPPRDRQLHITQDLGDGVRLECFALLARQAEHLLCLFPSAQLGQGDRRNPAFHRWSWAYQLPGFHTLSISDPGLYETPLHANWFQSPQGHDHVQAMAGFIAAIARQVGMPADRVVLYGSSMGGFGALMVGAHLPASMVIAEVPQIDLRRYPIASSLRQLEREHFAEQPIGDYHLQHGERIDVLERYRQQRSAPSLHIVTNEGDPAFGEHLEFVAAMGRLRAELRQMGDVSLTCRSQAIGHKPLPTPDALRLIRSAVAQGWTLSTLADAVPAAAEPAAAADSYRTVLNAAIEQASKVRYTRTPEDCEHHQAARLLLQKAAEIDPTADWPLLKLCSMVKLWNNSFGGELPGLASEAFRRRQTLEAYIYSCRGIVATSTPAEALVRLDGLQRLCRDPQTAQITHIFRAMVRYELDDFSGYEQEIRRFQQQRHPDFRPYIAIPVSTVMTDTGTIAQHDEQHTPRLLGIELPTRVPVGPQARYLISASCDRSYFEHYGPYIVRSFSATCAQEAHLHITLTGAPSNEVTQRLQEWGARHVSVAFAGLDGGNNEGPLASLLRFCVVHALLRQYRLPVFVFDLDAVIRKPLGPIVDAYASADVCSRVLKGGVAPWEKYTGGFALFHPTANGRFIARAIAAAAEHLARAGEPQWWIDQNCFEAGLRTARQQGLAPTIVDFYAARNACCTMPVGTREAKLLALREALASLPVAAA